MKTLTNKKVENINNLWLSSERCDEEEKMTIIFL